MEKTTTAIRTKRPRIQKKTQPAAEPATVRKIVITIEKDGMRKNHELYFDKDEPLTLTEMYSVGFLGDISFENKGGIVQNAELEAGPKGEFVGEKVGSLVFRIYDPVTKHPIDARVIRFAYFQ